MQHKPITHQQHRAKSRHRPSGLDSHNTGIPSILKHTLILLGVSAATALAGTTETVASNSNTTGDPGLWTWFVGAGADSGLRYRFHDEFGASEWTSRNSSVEYDIQVGAYSPWTFGGCKLGFYLEGGWEHNDGRQSGVDTLGPPLIVADYKMTTSMIPVTFNALIERPLFGDLNVFATLGAGPSFMHFHGSKVDTPDDGNGGSFSKDTIFFYPQASIGLSYDLTKNLSLYADTRFIGLNGKIKDTSGFPVERFQSTLTYEGGVRWKF